MIFQNISNETSGNFYSGFMELELLKLFYIIFNIILTFVAPLTLYSIVWYERFGSDLMYRTLSNRILSHIWLISIARCLIARIANVGFLFMIPLSSNTCDVINYIHWTLWCFMFIHWNCYLAAGKVLLHI